MRRSPCIVEGALAPELLALIVQLVNTISDGRLKKIPDWTRSPRLPRQDDGAGAAHRPPIEDHPPHRKSGRTPKRLMKRHRCDAAVLS